MSRDRASRQLAPVLAGEPEYLPNVYDIEGWEDLVDSGEMIFCESRILRRANRSTYVCTRQLGHCDDHAEHHGAGIQMYRWAKTS